MKRETCILLVLYNRNEMFSNYRECEIRSGKKPQKNLKTSNRLSAEYFKNIKITTYLRNCVRFYLEVF